MDAYRFTEVSPLFLRRGQRSLAARPDAAGRLAFARLDIDRPFAEAGIEPGTISVVYGVDTLHVARDLPFSLAEIRRALAPGGLVLAAECMRPFAGRTVYVELVFVLLEAFRRPGGSFRTPGGVEVRLRRSRFRGPVRLARSPVDPRPLSLLRRRRNRRDAPMKARARRLRLPEAGSWFEGHFPGDPVLPGIAHLALLDRPIGSLVSLRLRFPLRPGDEIDIEESGPDEGGLRHMAIRKAGAEASRAAWRDATGPDAVVPADERGSGVEGEDPTAWLSHRPPNLCVERLSLTEGGVAACAVERDLAILRRMLRSLKRDP